MPPRCAGRRRRSPSPERPANDELDEILEEERVAAARGERLTKKTKITAVVVGALGVIGAAVLALSTVLPRANEPFALETNLTDAFPQKAANERDQKIVKNKKLHTAEAVQKARNRIYRKTATAKKNATSKKVKALEVLKAELEVEVKELQARKAVMPGSAVFHS